MNPDSWAINQVVVQQSMCCFPLQVVVRDLSSVFFSCMAFLQCMLCLHSSNLARDNGHIYAHVLVTSLYANTSSPLFLMAVLISRSGISAHIVPLRWPCFLIPWWWIWQYKFLEFGAPYYCVSHNFNVISSSQCFWVCWVGSKLASPATSKSCIHILLDVDVVLMFERYLLKNKAFLLGISQFIPEQFCVIVLGKGPINNLLVWYMMPPGVAILWSRPNSGALSFYSSIMWLGCIVFNRLWRKIFENMTSLLWTIASWIIIAWLLAGFLECLLVLIDMVCIIYGSGQSWYGWSRLTQFQQL